MDQNNLEEENKRLKAELNSIYNQKKEKNSRRLRWTKRLSSSFLGKNLKSAITNFFTELEEKRSVSKNTVSDLLSAIFMRVTRIGVYLIITSLLPTLFLLFQIYYLRNQNELITIQNTRAREQTYLQEADRRSMMTGVLDDMIKEVTSEGYRNGGKIANANSIRLIALSKILKPYKYLENDNLTKLLSPERGYLLLSLLESNLDLGTVVDNSTRESLLSQINFNYAELKNATMTSLDLNRINLDHANLDGSNFTKSTFIKGSFQHASLKDVNFHKSDILKCNFYNANLDGASFADSSLNNISFEKAILTNADFSNCDLTKINLLGAEIIGAKFDKAIVSSNWIEEQKDILSSDNYEYLIDNYKIKTQDKRALIIVK